MKLAIIYTHKINTLGVQSHQYKNLHPRSLKVDNIRTYRNQTLVAQESWTAIHRATQEI